MKNGEETAEVDSEAIESQEDSATSEQSEETKVEAEGEQSEAKSEESDDKSDSTRKPGAEKRIGQLTWQLKEQERRYQELASKLEQQTQKPSEPSKPRPTLESVGFSEEEYAKQMEEYLASQIESRVDSRLTAREQEQQQRQQHETLQQKTSEFFRKGIDLADDFADVISNESLPVTESMRDALFSVDKGPEILYSLAQNPAELSRIASLNPYAQAVEIGRLEARMSMPQSRQTSSAPPPVKPLSAGGESVKKDPDNMSVKEWQKWREKQLRT